MTPKLAEVPTLDAIAADPRKAAALPRRALLDLAVRALELHAVITTALIAAAGEPAARDEDRLLTYAAAAAVLGRTYDWLTRNADRLPFTVREEGHQPRFSSKGIQAYIARAVARQQATVKGA